MAHVLGGIVPSLLKDAKLALTVDLNMSDQSIKAQNQQLATEYGQYNVPVHLVEVQFSKSGDKGSWSGLPGTNKAIVMPPGCFLEFLYSYKCHLGYGFAIYIQPEGKPIVSREPYKSLYVTRAAGQQTPTYLSSSLRRFSDAKTTIQLIDWHDFAQYDIPADTAKQAWLIDFEVWPIYSYSPGSQDAAPVSVDQHLLEQHYASGTGGAPAEGWMGDARKGHVLRGPSSDQTFGGTIYNVQERRDLGTKLSFMALVVVPGKLGDFQIFDWANRSAILDD